MTPPNRASAAPKSPPKVPQRVRKVALSSINIDPAIQPRLRMSKDAVARYTQIYRNTPNGMPPILLGTSGPGSELILIDGFHRVRAAERARLTKIAATIIEITTTEAEWLAVEANFKHGVPLTRAEKRTVFRRFVRARRNRSEDGTLMSSRDLAIAIPIGSHQSMLTWMKSDFPNIYAEMTGNGLEEDEPQDDEASKQEDQVLANIEWAASEYLAAIRKASAIVEKEKIAATVHDIRERVGAALGVQDLAQLLPDEAEDSDF